MTAALFPDLVINGETVPHALVAAEVQNHAAPSGKPGLAWRKAARAMATRTLLLQEARRVGVVAEPREVAPGKFERVEEALIRGLLETALVVETPSDEDVHAEWSRNPSRFRAPPLWEVSHILVAFQPSRETERAAAHARARELAMRVAADPASFARLASAHSDCESKSSGGFLGQIGPGDTVPEFEAALRGMMTGEITGEPVLTRHGFHLIRLDAHAEGAELPFEAVREKLSLAMEKAAWAASAKAFLARLAAKAEITGAEMAPVELPKTHGHA